MNTPDSAAGEPLDTLEAGAIEQAETELAAAGEVAGVPEAAEVDAETEPAEREPVVTTYEREVTLERSVRYGRVIVVGLIAGAFLGMLFALLTPVDPEGNYSLGQIVGFMALIGGIVGLTLACILSVILGAVAKRRRGTGVAIQTDVR